MLNNVYVNGRYRHRPVTGVERYAGEISKRLFQPGREISPRKPLRGLAGHAWEQATLPQRLPPGTLLWSPANTGPLGVRQQAITIHDLAPLDHPGWYRPAFRLWYSLILPRLARNSRLVITVSRFSRRRISERFGISAERIVLVPAGVDRNIFFPRDRQEIERVKRKFEVTGEYLLMVGTIQPRKNLSGLLNAGSVVGRDHPGLALVIAGGMNRIVFPEYADHPLDKGKVRTGHIPDGELAALYSGALALLFPSFYEGFGLPLLEAMACGAPILASSAGALPEIAGEAGLYFDPGSRQELVQGILSIIEQAEMRENLRWAGYERAIPYTWENSAAALEKYLAAIS